MITKIKYFLQTDYFILLIALIMGILCHFFVATEVIIPDQTKKDIRSTYMEAFSPPKSHDSNLISY